MTSVHISAEKITATINNKDCWGCIHYNGQFGTIVGHNISGYCHRDPIAKFFVEADHSCRKFTHIHEDVPTTLADALNELETMLDSMTHDDCSYEATIGEMLADKYEVAEEALAYHYDFDPILSYNVILSAEWRTIPGAGWGAYYGPTPDEHEGTVTITVYDNNGALIVDEGGTWEDYGGGNAIIGIRRHIDQQKAA